MNETNNCDSHAVKFGMKHFSWAKSAKFDRTKDTAGVNEVSKCGTFDFGDLVPKTPLSFGIHHERVDQIIQARGPAGQQ